MQWFKEHRDSLWMALAVGMAAGFVLAGYEFIRNPSNTLYVQMYGKERLAFIMGMVPIGVFILLYLYSRMLSAIGPKRTLIWSTVICLSTILCGWKALQLGWAPAAGILYIFRSAYVVLLIEQYWSLINTSLTQSDAKRFNGLICGIASIGAVLGGMFGERLTMIYGTVDMVAVAALLTAPAGILSIWAYSKASVVAAKSNRAQELVTPSQPKGTHLAWELFTKQPTLIYILILVLMTQSIVTALGITFQSFLQDAMPNADAQTSYGFRFYTWVNSLAAVGQFVITPILLSRFSMRFVQISMPTVVLGFSIYAVLFPGLESAGLALLIFKALDYSIFRAAKEVFYVPMSFDARFRAKEVIDILGYRTGKGLSGALFDVVQRLGVAMTAVTYGVWSAVFSLAWILCAWKLTSSKIGASQES
jgi:AAA family ATP:ADP antiporter